MLAVVASALVALAPGAAATLPRADVQSQQWWITRLDLRNAWKITEGRGVTVAVIDSGVDARFGDLRGAVESGFGAGVSGNGQRDGDDAYHGTRMADMIAGRGTGFGLLGVAPKASILPVAVQYKNAGGTAGQANIADALTRLAAKADPPDIVNMSLGVTEPCSADLQQAVQAATAKGMILVASAGNTSTENLAPANCTGVVAVGAYSNDAQPWEDTAQQPYVTLAGPGVRIIGYSTSAASGYGYAFGTSDATAVVSGSFALARAHFPKTSSRDLVTRMFYTARQFGGKQGTRNDTWGYGAARPQVALTGSVPRSAPNPVYDALDKLTPSTSPSAAPSTSGSTAGTASDAPSSAPASTPAADSGASDDSSSTGLIIGLIAAVVIAAAVVVLIVVSRRRRSTPPASW